MRHGSGIAARALSAPAFVVTAALFIWAATHACVAAQTFLREHFRAGAASGGTNDLAATRGTSPFGVLAGTTPSRPPQERAASSRLPRPIRFREVEGRGLLIKAWVNGAGPYTFALDTGAGATLLSRRVAAEARIPVDAGRPHTIQGLSGRGASTARRAQVNALSLGDPANTFPARGLTLVAEALPADFDGVLDPGEVFWPLGYVIDFPREDLSLFDSRLEPLRRSAGTENETVVPWLSDGVSRRPFVALAGGQRALLDTGSNFGLAVAEHKAHSLGILPGSHEARPRVRDLGGGFVAARRVRPATIAVGSLVLRGVPTDVLRGAAHDAPVLLGRDALRPFRLAFDPLNRLIRIDAPAR